MYSSNNRKYSSNKRSISSKYFTFSIIKKKGIIVQIKKLRQRMATKDTNILVKILQESADFFWIISLCNLSFLSWDNWNIKVPYLIETRKYFASLQKVAKTRKTTIYQLVFSRSLLKYLKRIWVGKCLFILKTHFVFHCGFRKGFSTQQFIINDWKMEGGYR